jgi:drug/metabolite transporter (DMT)-like permease
MYGCLGVAGFSGTAPATRAAAPAFGPVTLTFARIVIAAVLGLVTILALNRGHWHWPGRGHVRGLLAMGAGLAVGFPLFLALGVERVPASHASIDIALVPAATAALAAARQGERQSRRFWLASATALAAVVTFACTRGGTAVHAGDLWLAAAVVSCAVGYVEGARIARAIGTVPALCAAMILLLPAAVPLLIVGAVTHPAGAAPASAWAGLAYAGFVSMFLASLAWYRGLAVGGTGRIGQLNLAQPFLSVAWAALLLGEHITWPVPVTAAIVLCCMAVCVRSPAEADRNSVPRPPPSGTSL